MTDNRTTELLDGLRHVGNLHEFAELFGFDWYDDSDWTWHDVAVKMADDFEQAIAATLGNDADAVAFCKRVEKAAKGREPLTVFGVDYSATTGEECERELIDLAHNAWSMALCAMQGMPIPAKWGEAVERGLRKYGINVDEDLAGFEVDDDER